jgi:prepilin-type N-terminal cleavage/methylation domain-containing protein
MKLSLNTEKGFTLIELLIAMVIMGIAFVGLANTQISCINSISNSRGLTNAVILAQDKMEELKSLDPGHPSLADTNPGNNSTLRYSIDPHDSDHREILGDVKEEAKQTVPNLSRSHYTRFWNIADNTPLPGRKTVTVIVSWKSGRKRIAISSVI